VSTATATASVHPAPSLRRRLMLLAVFGAAVAALLGAVAAHAVFRATLEAELDDGLTTRARALSALVQRRGYRLVVRIDPAAFPEYRTGADQGSWWVLLDGSGNLLLRSLNAPDAALATPMAPTTGIFRDLVLPSSRRLREHQVVFIPAPADEDEDEVRQPRGDTVNPVRLRIARDRSAIDRPAAVLSGVLAAVGVLVVAAAAAAASLAVRWLLRPLASVASFAEDLDSDRLDRRLATAGIPVELLPVCLQLNALLDRLAEGFAREKRFTGDVAHELRTPVAELRALSEMALTWPDSVADPARHHGQVHAIAGRMAGIVDGLLALHRHEQQAAAAAPAPVALAGLVDAAWWPRSAAAAAKGLRWSCAVAADAVVVDDARLLAVALDNLIGNAVEYAAVGGALAVEVVAVDGGLCLTVTNTVDDLAPADLSHLGERFWRKDAARSGGAHCGLGLSLVRAICARLGLDLGFALPAPDRFVVSIGNLRLAQPIASAAAPA